jgi:hypothetical protein
MTRTMIVERRDREGPAQDRRYDAFSARADPNHSKSSLRSRGRSHHAGDVARRSGRAEIQAGPDARTTYNAPEPGAFEISGDTPLRT